MTGEHEKSIQYHQRAMQLAPQDSLAFESYMGISGAYFFLRRYDQALHWSERALREKPHFLPALMLKIAALAMDGSHPEELQPVVQRLKAMLPRPSISGSMKRLVVYRSSDRELFETALRKAGFPD